MGMASIVADWIAVDWGTSNLRIWAVRGDAAPVLIAQTDEGMARVSRGGFASVLAGHCAQVTGTGVLPVLVCGMAGARQGWVEAPYLDTPARLAVLGAGAVTPGDAPAGLAVRIVPGVCQRIAGAEDVMRGEETQLLGLTVLRPGFSGLAILPGTHSKWARIEDGVLDGFATAMTGDIFTALAGHSVLSLTVAPDEGEEGRLAREKGIAEGLDAGLEAPERLASLVFRARTAALLSDQGPDWCRGYLSGVLVGAEIGGRRAALAGQAVVPVIGSARLVDIYSRGLARCGHEAVAIDATAATLAGLGACLREMGS